MTTRSLGMWIIDEKTGLSVIAPDVIAWGEFMENGREAYHRKDTVGSLWVSTVFLGVDHSFGGGDPVLWETMLFDKDAYFEEQRQWRFVHMDQAHSFHEQLVAEVKDKFDKIDTATILKELLEH